MIAVAADATTARDVNGSEAVSIKVYSSYRHFKQKTPGTGSTPTPTGNAGTGILATVNQPGIIRNRYDRVIVVYIPVAS